MAKRKAPKVKPPLDPASEAWNKIPWRKLEQHCFRLQKRIFRASQRGNTRAVHKLQKLLMQSQAARLLAVRRVTQDNQGKKTAGIDGVKSVRPAERFIMANHIHPKNGKATSPPVRRVWIPKPGKAEKRPLGIPVVVDRCLQAMVKNALEPAWEARFEGSSYGFRPGRSCHDAIEKIYLLARPNKTKKWVLDADLKGAFDNISHDHLLKAISTRQTMCNLHSSMSRRLIKRNEASCLRSLIGLISCCVNLEKQRPGWMGEVCFLSAGKWLSYMGQRH